MKKHEKWENVCVGFFFSTHHCSHIFSPRRRSRVKQGKDQTTQYTKMESFFVVMGLKISE